MLSISILLGVCELRIDAWARPTTAQNSAALRWGAALLQHCGDQPKSKSTTLLIILILYAPYTNIRPYWRQMTLGLALHANRSSIVATGSQLRILGRKTSISIWSRCEPWSCRQTLVPMPKLCNWLNRKFLQRGRALALWRQIIRSTRRIADENTKRETRALAKVEFERNKSVTDIVWSLACS